jgi:hypothetical protein
MALLKPFFRYSGFRHAYVLRGVGRSIGPVLRVDRRRSRRIDSIDRRRERVA